MSVRFVKLAEVMHAVVAIIKKRRPIDDNWRVEAPAKWAIKDPIGGQEGPGVKPRSPVPTRPDPTGAVPTAPNSNVNMRCVNSGF